MTHDSQTYQAFLSARYLVERLHRVYVLNSNGFESTYDKRVLWEEYESLQKSMAILQDKES
jgi:hypothetical protein